MYFGTQCDKCCILDVKHKDINKLKMCFSPVILTRQCQKTKKGEVATRSKFEYIYVLECFTFKFILTDTTQSFCDRSKNDTENDKRELVFKEEGQEYALVGKMLGNGWLEAMCCDEVKRLAHIRGAFRKRIWISVGDTVLLSLRDFQDNKADVILKYTPEEAKMLKSYGEIPENIQLAQGDQDDELEIEFDIDAL